MVVDALISRTGVYVYRNADGTERKEYRPDSTVFAPAAMKSFELKPITNLHPLVGVGSDEANAKALGKGIALEGIHRDGIHVAASLLIDDPQLYEAMRGGMREVSCGYECDLDETPGTAPDGQRYDAMQLNIVGDHIAIVPGGRAGSARVKMDRRDAAEMIDIASEPGGTQASNPLDMRITMDELKKALGEALAEVEKQKARADKHKDAREAAEKDRDAHKARADKAEGERDTEKARADKAEKSRDDAKADAEKARKDALDAQPATVKARVSLERDALDVLGADAKIGDKSIADAASVDIKLAVVKKIDGVDIDVKAKSEAYLDGRFDTCVANHRKGDAALAETRENVETHRDASTVSAEDKARQDMINRGRYSPAQGAK